jgi:DNA-binding transcriptional ArsR family regulator
MECLPVGGRFAASLRQTFFVLALAAYWRLSPHCAKHAPPTSGKLNVTSPTVTQHINSLEAQELVERHADPADRRVVRIRLSDKGTGGGRKPSLCRDDEKSFGLYAQATGILYPEF